MNFRNIMILVAVAVVITTGAGLLSPDPEIRKMAALSLIDDGKYLMGAAVGILAPQLQRAAASVVTAVNRRISGQHTTIEAQGKEQDGR
jgi:hypothetical protein